MSFAKRLAHEFPMWQVSTSKILLMIWTTSPYGTKKENWIWLLFLKFLLVDLRCHGDSASIKKRGPHTVASTAFDVLKLVCIFLSLIISLLSSKIYTKCVLAHQIWIQMKYVASLEGHHKRVKDYMHFCVIFVYVCVV